MRAQLVWVVTDQEKYFHGHREFVRAVLRQRPDIVVKHLYASLSFIRHDRANVLRVQIRNQQRGEGLGHHPLILFRDAESLDREHLVDQQRNMEQLCATLRTSHPNVCGHVFNPMSEAAALIFDGVLEGLVTELATLDRGWDPAPLQKLASHKRNSQFVNKDLLKEALLVNSHEKKVKTLVDNRLRALFAGDLPVSDDPAYSRLVNDVRACVDRAFGAG